MGSAVKRDYEAPAILESSGIIEMAELARALTRINPSKPWSTERTRDRFTRCGWAFKVGGRWVVASQKIRDEAPDLWQALRLGQLDAGEE